MLHFGIDFTLLNNIYITNKLLILFFVSYNFILLSAEELQYSEDEPEQSPMELSISTSEAYKYSDELTSDHLPLCPEQLVLAIDQTTYNYAIVFPLVNDNTIYLKVLKKDIIEPYTTDKIRILKLLPQILLQPHLPQRLLMLFFHKIYTKKSELPIPFIQSKILRTTSKILVIGGLNGNFETLRQILFNLHSLQYIDNKGILAPDIIVVFTGNLTGQAPDGPDIWHFIRNFKKINTNQVFTLKGLHETLDIARCDHFYD
jgi:hypothetical protein